MKAIQLLSYHAMIPKIGYHLGIFNEHCKTGACKITCDGYTYPVPQLNLPTDAGKNLLK